MFIKTGLIISALLLFNSAFSASGQVIPQKCQLQRVKLQMLGTRGPELLDGQASTGYLIWLDNKARVIIDAGPGSLRGNVSFPSDLDVIRP